MKDIIFQTVMSTSVIPGVSSTMASAINATTATLINMVNVEPKSEDTEPTPIFLQTKAAQGIAGAFVALALFLTCQQVRVPNFFIPLELH